MNDLALFVIAIALLPAFGMAAWMWLDTVRADEDLRAIVGLGGLQFKT